MRHDSVLRDLLLLLAAGAVFAGCTMFADSDEFAEEGGGGTDTTGTDTHGSDSGPDPGPQSCASRFEPCGGDVIGTWSIVEACVDPGMFTPECAGATAQADIKAILGSLVIEGTKRYERSTTVEMDIVTRESCSSPVECSTMGCEYNPGECTCRMPIGNSGTDTGGWSTNGGELTISSDNSPVFVASYCVMGDWLVMDIPGTGREIYHR